LSKDAARDAYLEEIFALDPCRDEERVLALRNAYLKQSGHPSQDGLVAAVESASLGGGTFSEEGEQSESNRARAERALAGIREQFWESSGPKLEAQLGSLELDELPDLARYRARLLRVAANHERVLGLVAELAINEQLAEVIRMVLIAPERTAAELRAKYIRASVEEGRTREDKRSIAVLEKQFPELHALEEAWFKKFRTAKKDRKDSRKIRGGIGCFGLYMLFIILRWLYKLITDQ